MIEAGKGILVVNRRPPCPTGAWNYLPCSHCYGFFLKTTLGLHIKGCKLNEQKEGKGYIMSGLSILTSLIPKSDAVMRMMINGIRETAANPGNYWNEQNNIERSIHV